MWVRGVLTCVLALALGCASAAKDLGHVRISADDLLTGTALGLAGDPPDLVDSEAVLAVSPEMAAFLDRHVSSRAADAGKLKVLVDAIFSDDRFGLEFEEATRTASEIFRLRRGNCLSFSNMFIAMAREVGLDARYQEVDVPPDWSLDRDVFVLNRHVNVRVVLGALGERVVDFNIGDFRASYDTRMISDNRAMSHNFNNLGVERMQAGDTASAFAYYRRAIAESDRLFSPAWTNLGTMYLRDGRPAHAEAAYLQALGADPDDAVAMSNLARLYELQGDLKRADLFRRRVVEHRMGNPYYRYYRAREEFIDQDYDAAIAHLKFAVRKRDNDSRFYSLLAECYQIKGKERAARRSLARAQELAAAEALKRGGAGTFGQEPPPPE